MVQGTTKCEFFKDKFKIFFPISKKLQTGFFFENILRIEEAFFFKNILASIKGSTMDIFLQICFQGSKENLF